MTAFGGTFGEDFSGSWGEPESESPSEHSDAAPGGDIGDGHFMQINEDAWKALMHSTKVTAAVIARAQGIADYANDNVELDPRAMQRLNPNGEPAYVVHVQNDPSTTRVRARVRPSTTNDAGFVDDAANSTLYKAMLASADGTNSESTPGDDTVIIEGGGL